MKYSSTNAPASYTKAADKGHRVVQSIHHQILGTDKYNTAGRTLETQAASASCGAHEMMTKLKEMMQCVVCGGDNVRKLCGFCKVGLVATFPRNY